MATILLSIPTYKNDVHAAAMFSIMGATKEHKVLRFRSDSSAQCNTLNTAWIQALELYDERKVDYFACHHTDIEAEAGWLDKLVTILKAQKADIISAVVPIKNASGFTSTAYDESLNGRDAIWFPRRLTMKEVCKLPKTFTAPNILLNTGLMLVDLSKPWTREMYFSFTDRIVTIDGKRRAVFEPEDWAFSRLARAHGATSLWATWDITLNHWGEGAYANQTPWGAMETDNGKVG